VTVPSPFQQPTTSETLNRLFFRFHRFLRCDLRCDLKVSKEWPSMCVTISIAVRCPRLLGDKHVMVDMFRDTVGLCLRISPRSPSSSPTLRDSDISWKKLPGVSNLLVTVSVRCFHRLYADPSQQCSGKNMKVPCSSHVAVQAS